MSEENVDEFIFDSIFFQINPVNVDTIKDYFMKTKYSETIGLDRDKIDIAVDKLRDDFYLIYKKRDGKTFAVYYWVKGKLFQSNNLKVIMEAKINRISFYYDKINKKVLEALNEEDNSFKKTKKSITLKKEFL